MEKREYFINGDYCTTDTLRHTHTASWLKKKYGTQTSGKQKPMKLLHSRMSEAIWKMREKNVMINECGIQFANQLKRRPKNWPIHIHEIEVNSSLSG